MTYFHENSIAGSVPSALVLPAVSPRKTGLRSTRAKVHENGGDIS